VEALPDFPLGTFFGISLFQRSRRVDRRAIPSPVVDLFLPGGGPRIEARRNAAVCIRYD